MFITLRRRRERRIYHKPRILHVLGITAFVMSMLLQSIPGGAAQPDTCADGEVFDSTTQTCVAMDATPVADAGTPVDDPQPSATIYVNAFVCPPGYLPDQASSNLYSDCSLSVDGITFTVNGVNTGYSGQSDTGDSIGGAVMFGGLETDTYIITQTSFPAGSTGRVWTSCPDLYAPGVYNGSYADLQATVYLADGQTLVCNVFAMLAGDAEPTAEPTVEPTMEPTPDETPGYATLFITKYECPAGYDPTSNQISPYHDCVQGPNGVNFVLNNSSAGIFQTMTGDSQDYRVMFGGQVTGDWTVTEEVPAGYSGSFVWECVGLDGVSQRPVVLGDTLELHPSDGDEITCYWFNIKEADADSTPTTEATPTTEPTPAMDGYASLYIYKWECPEGYDPYAPGADPAVECASGMNGVNFMLDGAGQFPLQSMTGDSQNYMVMFGGQEVGYWIVTEDVPAGYTTPFVWDCTGLSDGSVNPAPLQVGNVLQLQPADGDEVVCNWYNIPESEDHDGDITVVKYLCDSEEFVSEVDCEIYENGVNITLSAYNESTATWDALGTQTTNAWGEASWNDLEPGSYGVSEEGATPCHATASNTDGNGIIQVLEAEQTIVKIFNCGWENHEPNKEPESWPNTGALQLEDDVCISSSAPNTQKESTGNPVDSGCERGAVPVSISIASINVDAQIEIIETVNGQMQAPTAPDIASWYKETARLGEQGNIVLAGHLNYWGVPEGVFFNLENLKEGDVITLYDVDGSAWEYEVTSVKQIANDTPVADVLSAEPGSEMLTLITCGGEWNASESEYESRTVVTAKRIPATQE